MSCNVTGQNMQNPSYSVLIRFEGRAGEMSRKVQSLSVDSILQLEEGLASGRADSVALEKTGPLQYRFRLNGAQISDRGFYYCEVTAWTRDQSNIWDRRVSAESNKIQLDFADTGMTLQIWFTFESWEAVECVTCTVFVIYIVHCWFSVALPWLAQDRNSHRVNICCCLYSPSVFSVVYACVSEHVHVFVLTCKFWAKSQMIYIIKKKKNLDELETLRLGGSIRKHVVVKACVSVPFPHRSSIQCVHSVRQQSGYARGHSENAVPHVCTGGYIQHG